MVLCLAPRSAVRLSQVEVAAVAVAVVVLGSLVGSVVGALSGEH